MTPPLHCLGVFALEARAQQARPAMLTLDRTAAESLADALAADLARLVPETSSLDGAFACAHFDPAELLRPGWPVYADLADLAARAPGRPGGRVIGIGSHDGRMPLPSLQPDPAHVGGLLRLLPFVLRGDADTVAGVGRVLEERLLDTGMASAGLALTAQSCFGMPLEHARFMTLHDLCALTAMQYRHAALEPAWRLLEAALLAPEAAEWLDAPGEPLAVSRNRTVRIAEPTSADVDMRRRVRQLAAILQAHGVEVERVAIAAGEDARALLQA